MGHKLVRVSFRIIRAFVISFVPSITYFQEYYKSICYLLCSINNLISRVYMQLIVLMLSPPSLSSSQLWLFIKQFYVKSHMFSCPKSKFQTSTFVFQQSFYKWHFLNNLAINNISIQFLLQSFCSSIPLLL